MANSDCVVHPTRDGTIRVLKKISGRYCHVLEYFPRTNSWYVAYGEDEITGWEFTNTLLRTDRVYHERPGILPDTEHLLGAVEAVYNSVRTLGIRYPINA